MRSPAFLICMLVAAVLPLTADQVTMNNGDRLTGSVVRFDEKQLVFNSLYAGSVTLPWDAVSEITTTAVVHVGLSDGQELAGTLNLRGPGGRVRTVDAGTVTVERSSIKYIRSPEEQAVYQAEYERLRNPSLTDLWTGFVDFGVAQAHGNAKTTNINTSADAVRTTTRDKIEARFTSIYASNGTTGVSVATANAIRGGASYQLDVTKKLFGFASVDLEYDQFQSLDLRFAPAGGLGYHLVKNERGTVDLLGGIAMNREFFSTGLDRTSAELVLGEEINYKLNSRVTTAEKLSFYPNLSNGGEYRINFDWSTATALWKWFSWQFTISDRFLSNPVPGRQRNDLLYTTGVRLTFARPEVRTSLTTTYGTLVPVYAAGTASVYANGRFIGFADLDEKGPGLRLPSGSYKVRIVPEGGGTAVEREVTVEAGKSVVVR